MTRKLLPDSDTTKTLKDFQRDWPNAKGGETRYRTREVLLPTLAPVTFAIPYFRGLMHLLNLLDLLFSRELKKNDF